MLRSDQCASDDNGCARITGGNAAALGDRVRVTRASRWKLSGRRDAHAHGQSAAGDCELEQSGAGNTESTGDNECGRGTTVVGLPHRPGAAQLDSWSSRLLTDFATAMVPQGLLLHTSRISATITRSAICEKGMLAVIP